MKLKELTKHPCLKGLLQATMYQRKDKSRSLRHSRRKALPKYKVQHWALICRSISLPSVFLWHRFTSQLQSVLPKALWVRADIVPDCICSASAAQEGFTVPACSHNSSKGKGHSCFPPQNRNSAAESLKTPTAISLSPEPKAYYGTGQCFTPLSSACRCIESSNKRCILNPPITKKQKGGSSIHTQRQEPVLQKAKFLTLCTRH